MTGTPSGTTGDVAALMDAARDRSPEGRARLFGLLGRLFLTRGAELDDSDRRGFIELLTLLRPMADLDTRLELAHATAQAENAPGELARFLAEDEIEVAALVLFGAEALGAAALIALAEDEERARIIAGRRHLPMMVADALMRRNDLEITRALLKSEGSKLSIPALDTAIELARTDADLQHRIAGRPELPEEMAKDMLDWVEPAVREHLVERFELAPGPAEIEARLRTLLGLDRADASSAGHGSEATDRSAPSGPMPDPRFRLSPRLMSDTLRRGELVHAEAMFARMAGLPAPLIRGFAKEGDGESIAIAARGIGMSREEFATLYLLWRKARSANGLVSAGELGAALDRFDTVAEDRVESLMADWRGGDATAAE
ncbi:MAG: DUF2336 domain-containing protein [Dongia sp.]